MAGFGFQKEKRLLTKVITSQNSKAYQEIIGKLCLRLGTERAIDLVMKEVLPTLPPTDFEWCYKTMLGQKGYERMEQQAMNTLHQILIDKGYTPGKDFSIHPKGGIILSKNASEALLADVPEEFRADIGADLKTTTIPSALGTLEKHLGVPFFDRLLQRISDRLPAYSNSQAAAYLAVMASGFENRTQIELFPMLMTHVKSKFPDRFQAILEKIKAENWDEPGSEVGIDLIFAAGGESELLPHPEKPGKYLISRKGLQVLASVFEGGERSVYELIAALDTHQRQQIETEQPEQ